MSKKCSQCETSYLTNDYDELCRFCLIERNSHREERICPRCLESFSVVIPIVPAKIFAIVRLVKTNWNKIFKN